MRLTDSKVKAIKSQEKRFIEWEDGQTGFGIRVAPTGKKTFVLMYRFNGKARMMSLGQYPIISLATGRIKAAQAKEKLSQGVDPGKEQLAVKAANKGAPTVSDLSQEFLEKWCKPNKRSWMFDQRALTKDILPIIGKKKAADVTRRDIVLLLDRIVDRGAPALAGRTLAVVRKMFNFGVGRSIIDASPCVAVPTPSKPKQRDRVLSESEIRSFWNGLENIGATIPVKLALKFQLATGQRRTEISKARWDEIDESEKWWTIPGETSKNGLPHRVAISPFARGILKEAKDISNGSPWIFPSPKGGDHVMGQSLYHAIFVNQEIFGIKHFTTHDLRRTAASHMASAGIPRLVIKKILNHAESDITAVYDRHSYDLEKKKAMNTWSRKLEAIITGESSGKIIKLKR